MTPAERLTQYKDLIDTDIAAYTEELLGKTEQEYGVYSKEVIESFTALLARGGKRLRGALVIASYEMLGGTDQQMILRAARAIEMIHAYVLMIDDIADRSPQRRGGPSAHMIMSDYHEQRSLKAEKLHFGESMATQAALIGGYLAEQIIDELNISDSVKLAVLRNLHKNLIYTGHGQMRDILNEVLLEVGEEDALWTATYKTAYYTVINPLETGAILAGVSEKNIQLLREFGMYAGIGFQIADDILGIFGEDDTTGKSCLDDLKEGKVTLLITYALNRASKVEAGELKAMLGNPNITLEDMQRCQKILVSTGALQYAQKSAAAQANEAKKVLGSIKEVWKPEFADFLSHLTDIFVTRKA